MKHSHTTYQIYEYGAAPMALHNYVYYMCMWYVVCVYVLHVYVCMEICLCLCVSASMGKPRNIRLKLVKCPSQEVTITQPLFCLSFLAIYAFSSLPFLSVRREEAHTPVKILAEPSASKPPVSRPNRLSADPTVNSEIISGIH